MHRFRNLMEVFSKYDIPVVPEDDVMVISECLLPTLHFECTGVRDSIVLYNLKGYNSVQAWFGYASHDSGGMYLNASLRLNEDDLTVKQSAIIIPKSPEDAKQQHFWAVLNAARRYPEPPPKPEVPAPAWRVEKALHDMVGLHKRWLESGRRKVLDNFREAL